MNLDKLFKELDGGYVYAYFPIKYDPPNPHTKVYNNGIFKFCDIEINDISLPFLKKMRNENARFILEDYKYYYSHDKLNSFIKREIEEVHKIKSAFSFKCSILLRQDVNTTILTKPKQSDTIPENQSE